MNIVSHRDQPIHSIKRRCKFQWTLSIEPFARIAASIGPWQPLEFYTCYSQCYSLKWAHWLQNQGTQHLCLLVATWWLESSLWPCQPGKVFCQSLHRRSSRLWQTNINTPYGPMSGVFGFLCFLRGVCNPPVPWIGDFRAESLPAWFLVFLACQFKISSSRKAPRVQATPLSARTQFL